MLLLTDILLVFIKFNFDDFLWLWRNDKDQFFSLMLYSHISLWQEKGFLQYWLSITWSSRKYFVQNSRSLIRNTEIMLLSSLIIPCVTSNQEKLYQSLHCKLQIKEIDENLWDGSKETAIIQVYALKVNPLKHNYLYVSWKY